MVRTHDIVIPPGTSWLNDPAARRVCSVIEDAGHRALFVGGCVRNALLGLDPGDLDLATAALPETVMQIAKAAGLNAIPTGIDHGTVTVVAGGTPFEITTFRRDVATDGRRAVVAFSNDIAEDARRRDFTMNALYATIEGQVLDPLGGLADLEARRIRFIEDPSARIREDYLRILRYFRFHAWYADPQHGFDVDALQAISENAAGLETLSAERVGQEMTRLLSADNPAPALATMGQVHVLRKVLPGADATSVPVLVHAEEVLGLALDWINRLAVLGGDAPAMRWRLSRADTRALQEVQTAAFEGGSLGEIAYRQGVRAAQGAMLLRATVAESLPERVELETISRASNAKFPVAAQDLMPRFEGPALGAKLRALEDIWIASGFTLGKATLLSRV